MGEHVFLEPEQIKELGLEKNGWQKTMAGGMPLYSDGYNQVLADGEDNCMVVGTTGSGKTRSFGIELLINLIDAKESFFSIDAKTTSYRYTFKYAKKAGYKLFVLNLRDPLKSQSQFWNPLGELWEMYNNGDVINREKAVRRLLNIGECIFQEEGAKDPFWNRSACSLFVGICLALFSYGEKEQATLYNAYRMVVYGEKRFLMDTNLKTFFNEIVGAGTEAYQFVSGYILAPSETRGGILSTYLGRMSQFSGLAIRNILCHDGFEMHKIKDNEKVGIYVILPDENRTFHQIGALFIKMLYQHYIELAENQGGRCRRRFNFVIDEFGNMNIPDADMMFSAIRSRNGRICIFLQTLEQLFYRYGKERGTTIKDNCGLQYYYGTSNLLTLRELEELSGKYRITDENGSSYTRPVLSVRDLQELPRRYVYVRFHGQQYIAYFPDISEYRDWHFKLAKFSENEILPLKDFDINHIVEEYMKKKLKERNKIETAEVVMPVSIDTFLKEGKEEK